MSKIIEHSANGRKYLIVEVPKDAEQFDIRKNVLGVPYSFYYKIKTGQSSWRSRYIGLPYPGNYRIMFVAEQATHEEVKAVMSATEFMILTSKVIPDNFTDLTKHHLILEKI